MKKHHEIEKVKIKGDVLYLVVDGKEIKRDLKYVSPLLERCIELNSPRRYV